MSAPSPESLHSATCVIHTAYDAAAPPPKPSAAWTRFVCVSDSHGRTFAVPPGDVLLHAGDLTNTGRLAEMRTTVEWLRELAHTHKIVIAGNHDLSLHQQDGWYGRHWARCHAQYRAHFGTDPGNTAEDIEPLLELLRGEESRDAGIVYLQNEQYEFSTKPGGRTWSVWGSPWSPEFLNWAFNYERGPEAERLVGAIPQTDILLTHTPPHGLLDVTTGGLGVGCEALRARLDAATLLPRLHVCGHIHEAHGAALLPGGTVLVNAASWPTGPRAKGCEFGEGVFAPVIVDLLDESAL